MLNQILVTNVSSSFFKKVLPLPSQISHNFLKERERERETYGIFWELGMARATNSDGEGEGEGEGDGFHIFFHLGLC